VYIPEEVKTRVAQMLGLEPEDLFDRLYRVTAQDLTTRLDFPNPFGRLIEVLDWNPDPTITCGGIHLVWGHPLLVFAFATRGDRPRFFAVPEQKIEGPVLSSLMNGIVRARAYTLFSEHELSLDAPEFDERLLRKIAKNSPNIHIRQAAARLLVDKVVLAETRRMDGANWFVRRLYALRKWIMRILVRVPGPHFPRTSPMGVPFPDWLQKVLDEKRKV